MKFFSNEAKESNEEPGYDRTDVATSEPVAVPQQRAGSPWSDAPGSPDDELAEQERRDGTDEGDGRAVAEPDDRVNGESTTTTYGPDGTVTTVDEDRADTDRDDTDRDDTDRDDAVKDEGTFDSPTAVDPATGESLDKSETDDDLADADRTDTEDRVDTEDHVDAEDRVDTEDRDAEDRVDEPVKDDGTFDAPVAVEPATGESLDKDEDEATPVADESPDADAVPVAAAVDSDAGKPGSVTAPELDRLFPDGDTFVERFRDIQLTFVDSPKEATAQAAALVGEVVDALTNTLKEQKDALAANASDDTEQLRVELRGYREMLNRLLAL